MAFSLSPYVPGLRCLLLASLLLLTPSCRRKGERNAPAYDLGASDALVESGLALEQGEGSWREWEREGRLAPQVARILQEENGQRELMEEASRLLQEQRFHDFGALLDQAEREGRATPALLELRGLPHALQALALFCARRPYGKSQDLEDSLNFLSPWRQELSRMAPRTFPPFWDSQEALLASLRQEEFQRECRKWEEELELCLLTRQWVSRVSRCLEECPRTGGKAELPGCLSAPPEEWLEAPGWSAARELASWLRWQELSPENRKSLERRLAADGPLTMAGRILQGRLARSPQEYMETLLLWQKAMAAFPGDFSPAFLEEYRELLPPAGKVAPVTGVAETANFLYRWLP
ncbi:MAG: hypothetical protein ACI4SG_08850 [Oligosphaeraceae bacterium]